MSTDDVLSALERDAAIAGMRSAEADLSIVIRLRDEARAERDAALARIEGLETALRAFTEKHASHCRRWGDRAPCLCDGCVLARPLLAPQGSPGESGGKCPCGNTPTCFGSYEGDAPSYGCDTCCGHGNEDGHCEPVGPPEATEPCALPIGVVHGTADPIECARPLGHSGPCSSTVSEPPEATETPGPRDRGKLSP